MVIINKVKPVSDSLFATYRNFSKKYSDTELDKSIRVLFNKYHELTFSINDSKNLTALWAVKKASDEQSKVIYDYLIEKTTPVALNQAILATEQSMIALKEVVKKQSENNK